MPNDAPDNGSSDFEAHLLRFIEAAEPLLAVQPNDYVGAQYIGFRNAALDAVKSPEVLSDTTAAWEKLHSDEATSRAAHLLMMELSAFSAAAEVAEKTSQEPAPTPSLKKRLLGIGGTIVGSLTDVLKLSDRAKAAWKIFGELLSIFRGE